MISHRTLLLGVNIDHAATLRQARYRDVRPGHGGTVEPDPVLIALLAEKAGADGITVHLREDRRHIQEHDVRRLSESIASRLNLEMACSDVMLDLALTLRPGAVCLVPENRAEVTTEGGLDLRSRVSEIQVLSEKLIQAGIAVSLFIDPDIDQIESAAQTGASHIELHTGAFSNAWHQPGERNQELDRLKVAARTAYDAGLTVNAGHGINYLNIADLLEVPHLHELNIGHAILSRALFSGIEEAVGTMKALLSQYDPR